MAATTWRSTLVAGLETLVNTYKTANPTLLRDVKRRRPATIGDTPLVYFGGRTESLNLTGSIMQRVVLIPVVVMDVIPDNIENADRVDDLVDALITLFKDNPHGAAANTLIEPASVTDIEDDFGTVPYAGSAIVVRCAMQEGLD